MNDAHREDREICEIVITASDAAWLTAFTRRLVEARLAACGQVTAPIRSVFRWAGEIQDDAEARVAVHTRRSLVPRIVGMTTEEHAYDVPCVIALPVVGGNPDYVRWILESTGEPGDS